jgi:hypothetical protein
MSPLSKLKLPSRHKVRGSALPEGVGPANCPVPEKNVDAFVFLS